MDYTTKPLIAAETGPLASEFKLTLSDLRRLFAQLPDPRRGPNLQYSLASLLVAALLGLLCNQLSQLAIAQWLADQTLELKQLLGFADGRTPHQTTFNRLFQKLEAAALERVLTQCFAPALALVGPKRGSQGVAIDGKCQRTRTKFETEVPGTPCHLLSLFSHQLGLVLAEVAIVNKEAELTVAPTLLAQIKWLGRVLTGDAMFCQRNICGYICEAGGDYLFVVKANQPSLQAAITTLFAPPTAVELAQKGSSPLPPLEITTAKVATKGHGRVEVREIKVSSELATYCEWPKLAQVFEVKREWWDSTGVAHHETHLGITSLPAESADLGRILELKRGHWGIENKLHWIRDVVLGEDSSTLHLESGPQVLAALRNTALNLLRLAGHSQISATLRANNRQVGRALALLGVKSPNA